MCNPEKRVLLFGGTTEGRLCAERVIAEGIPCTVCVATAYGEQVMRPDPLLDIRTGRMDREEMAQMMLTGSFICVIDATHPHARAVTEEIMAASKKAGLPYLRLERDLGEREGSMAADDSNKNGPRIIRVGNIREAGAFLSGTEGAILVTTGSKELRELVRAIGDPSRVIARVLPSAESLEACTRAGLTGRQVFAMQGPFDKDMNCALIRHAGAAWMLTKETGGTGGYPEKIAAAEECGIGVVSICAPGELKNGDPRMDIDRVMEKVREIQGHSPMPAGRDSRRELALVGIGTGSAAVRTREAEEALAGAQVIFGAESVLRLVRENRTQQKYIPYQKYVPVYDGASILAYLRQHPGERRAAAVYSGDSGFYSGASSVLSAIRKEREELPGPVLRESGPDQQARENGPDLHVRVICGISSVSCFAAKAGIPWQNWKIISSHGRECNVIGHVRRHTECFLLLSGDEDVRRTGALLAEAQEAGILGELRIVLGYELSRPGEKIRSCTAAELTAVSDPGLYVMYIGHDSAKDTPLLPGLPDSAFIRGKAPMTSSEIRALSLSRLGLTSRAVVWDVGAGTGSVSVEAALACPGGHVFAVEYKEEALELLRGNRAKFCLQNMTIREGRAPDALRGLPAPTHVFVGGSGGEIGEILKAVLGQNPAARVVVNCITAETLAALMTALPELPARDVQCIQVSVQRGEKLGRYHYLRALNPVFIISFTGNGPAAGAVPSDSGD